MPTPTQTISPTPTDVIPLPPLAPTVDATGSAVSADIGIAGGGLSTADGRVSVEFPPGLLTSALHIQITRTDQHALTPPTPDMPFVGSWEFDATDIGTGASTHTFPGSISIVVRLAPGELAGRDPQTLAFWTFDEPTQQWVRVPAKVDALHSTLTVVVNHFSSDGVTANNITDLAPLLDASNTDLHAGGTSLSIPIEVPPGRGGLTPQLSLSYDSGRVGEMRQYAADASWAGLGWDLTTGSITVSPGTDEPYRVFVESAGVSGEILPDGTLENGKYVWRARDEQYARIRTDCLGPEASGPFAPPTNQISTLCSWWITDKSGRVYTYGGDAPHSRFTLWAYSNEAGAYWLPSYYRFDLKSIRDPSGDEIDFSYWQQSATDPTCAASHGYQTPPTGCSYIVAAYPSEVDYNYMGSTPQSKIVFNPAGFGVAGATAGIGSCDFGTICHRADTPADNTCGYTAPLVRETQRLTDIEVLTSPSPGASPVPVRTYRLAHQAGSFYTGPFVNCTPYVGYIDCSWNQGVFSCYASPTDTGNGYVGGADLLTGLTILGSDQTSTLVSEVFHYAAFHNSITNPIPVGLTHFNWQYLTEADNGLGGATLFDYTEAGVGVPNQTWTRDVLASETHRPGFGEPDVTTTYQYGTASDPGPDFDDYPDPYAQPRAGGGTAGKNVSNALYRGFSQVIETDNGGTTTTHTYFTTGTYCCTPPNSSTTTPDAWQAEVLNGRESSTITADANGTVLRSVVTTWQTTPLPNTYKSPDGTSPFSFPFTLPGQPYQSFINFAFPLQVATTLGDGSQTGSTTYVQNQFDAYGDQTLANNFTGTAPVNPNSLASCNSANGCQLSTSTGFVEDVADNIFVPAFEAATDPESSNNGLVSCSRMYYDGATSAGTLPASGARGVLTAKSTATSTSTLTCDATTAFPANGSSNSYTAYDQYGNVVAASNATTIVPETYAPPAILPGLPADVPDSAHGWIPTGVPYAGTTYDSTYHIFPVTQTTPSDAHASAETTSTSYNFLFGKPSQVTSPQGDVTNYLYDTFGRVTDVYDNFDSQLDGSGRPLYPTRRFMYNWGPSAPNQTITFQRVTSGTGEAKISVSCADGLGREIEHQESFNTATGPHLNDIRTDYDVRGLKAVVTNPVDSGIAADPASVPACPSTPPAVTGRARTSYAYDPLGNLTTTTYLKSSDAAGNCVAPLGPAACTETNVDGLTTTHLDELAHKTVTTSDPAARTKTVTQFNDQGGGTGYTAYATTTSTYDALGRLSQVADDQGNVTQIAYDLAGRKIAMADPDMHDWTYAYDAAGNLVSQTDARGITTALTYDALNRLRQRDYSDGQVSDVFTYDAYAPALCTGSDPDTAIGRETLSQTGGVAGQPIATMTRNCFDVRGNRVTQVMSSPDGGAAITSTFNDVGQPTTITYPGGEVLTYDYASDGSLTGLSSPAAGQIADEASYFPNGALRSFRMGGGVASTSYSYDERERLASITTQTSTATPQSLVLTYDDASNVKTTDDDGSGTHEVLTYTYDALNRLTGAAGYLDGSIAAYTYDTIGNLTTKSEGQAALSLAYPAAGDPNSSPHAVSSTSGTLAQTFQYDADGDMTGSGQTAGGDADHVFYEYDAGEHLIAMDRSTAAPTTGTGWTCIDSDYNGTVTILDLSFISAYYDDSFGEPAFNPRADLNWSDHVDILDLSAESAHQNGPCASDRTAYIRNAAGDVVERTQRSSQGTTWTIYAGGDAELHSDGSQTNLYSAFGRVIAMRQLPAGGGSVMSYLLADHLGSTVGMLDGTGNVAGTACYWPYGAQRSATGVLAGPLPPATDKLYTGQQQQPADPAFADTTLGLYDYRARFYSTVLGAFVSADTVGDGLNRYGYVHDNPLRYVDPTGHCSSQPCPVPAPSPEGTATPPPTDLDRCAANPQACLMWAAGGNWGSYIRLTASYFHVDAEALSAIVLNEIEHRGPLIRYGIDRAQATLAEFLRDNGLPGFDVTLAGRTFSAKDPSLGFAQLKISVALMLADKKYVPEIGVDAAIEDLESRAGSIFYAAAYLSYLNEHVVGPQNSNNWRALAAAYNNGPNEYESAALNPVHPGCGWCGIDGQNEVRNVQVFIDTGDATDALAVTLDDW